MASAHVRRSLTHAPDPSKCDEGRAAMEFLQNKKRSAPLGAAGRF